MRRFVTDASISLAWILPDEASPFSDALLQPIGEIRILVPNHWALEVANGLAMAERKGRISSAQIRRAVLLLESLPIDPDSRTSERALTETLSLAQAHSLTTYDAAYMELCLREGLALATLDRELRSACERIGIPLYPST